MWPGPGTYNPSARPRTSGAQQQKKYSHESMKCNRDPRLDRLDPNSWCQHLPNVVYFQDIICRLLAWPWPALSHPVICAGRAGRGMRARVRLMIPIIRQKPLFIHHCGSCDPQATTQQTANIPFAPRCSHLNPFTCERVSYEDSLSRCRKWQKVSAMSLLHSTPPLYFTTLKAMLQAAESGSGD